MREILCEYCGKKYSALRRSRRFCSKLCISRNNFGVEKERIVNGQIIRKKKGAFQNCKTCKKRYYIWKCFIGKSTYCSRACQYLGQRNRTELKCKICRKKYSRPKSQILYRGSSCCSKECRWLLTGRLGRGSKSHFWKGGISPKHRRIRYSAASKKWRESVFERDNWTCQKCRVRGKYLEAHHIKPFAYFPKMRLELSNGETLCRDCHNKTKIGSVRMRKIYEKIT